MDFSPAFLDLLAERASLKHIQYALQFGIGFLSLVTVICIRRKWLVLLLLSVLAVLSVEAASWVFDRWWSRLNAAATSEGDHTWLADHDGGLMLVGIELILFAGMFWLISVTIVALIWLFGRGGPRKAPESPPAKP